MLRSWVVQYRRAGGTRRITLGTAAVLSVEQARKEAKKALGRVAIGEDPQADRIDRRGKDQHSFRSVAEEYLKAKQPNVRPRTFVEFVALSHRRLSQGAARHAGRHLTRKDIAGRLIAITRESGNCHRRPRRAPCSTRFYVWAMQMGSSSRTRPSARSSRRTPKGATRVLVEDTDKGRPMNSAAIWSACGDDDYGRSCGS